MSDTQKRLQHFQEIEDLAHGDSPIHHLHPTAKLMATLVYLLVLASFGRYELSGIVPLVLYPVAVLSVGRLPVAFFLKRVLYLAPFILLLAGANPLLDHAPMAQWHGIAISGGWISFFSILLRFVLAVTAGLALLATTGIHDLCTALVRIGVPVVVVTQMLFLYRYLSLLLEEVQHVLLAYALRSGEVRPSIARTAWGSLLGNLMIRTHARAQRIHAAMRCRGFGGELRFITPLPARVKDVAYVISWAIFLVGVRRVNIPQWLDQALKGVWG